jgi:hypothetical protein
MLERLLYLCLIVTTVTCVCSSDLALPEFEYSMNLAASINVTSGVIRSFYFFSRPVRMYHTLDLGVQNII